MLNIILTSDSPLKTAAVKQALKSSFGPDSYVLAMVNTDVVIKPPQPVNEGILTSALKRTALIEKTLGPHDRIIISIESGIIVENDQISDICTVVFSTPKLQISNDSYQINVPIKYYEEAVKLTPQDYLLRDQGLSVTIGEMIQREHEHICPKNWMKDELFGSEDRFDQIMEPLLQCFLDYKKYQLRNNILYFDNFPKPGVSFKDLSKIMQDPTLLAYLVDCLVDRITQEFDHTDIDKIVGLDARGFIFGPLLAYRIKAGFVMARKKGKLPSSALCVEYGTEYSKDSIEIMDNVINPGDKVLIIDDLVATGGSLDAAKQLIQGVGGIVIAACCILQVDDLLKMAKEKLKETPLIVILD